MITAAEAQQLTAGSIPEEKAKELLEDVDQRIRNVASLGQSHLRMEGCTEAQCQYLRVKLSDLGFTVSDVGLTIYW